MSNTEPNPFNQELERLAAERAAEIAELYPCTGKPLFDGFNKVRILLRDGDDLTPPDVVVTNIIEALHKANTKAGPHLFQRAGTLVSIYFDQDCQPSFRVMTDTRLRRIVDHAVTFFVINYVLQDDGTHQARPKDVEVPTEVLKKLLQSSELPFPKISELSTVPGMRPDGTVHDEPGFDAASGRYLIPRPNEKLLPVSEKPTAEEVAEAKRNVEFVLKGFPFVDDGSKANAIGMLLTPFVRCLHNKLVPLHTVSAKSMGTGKTKLCETSIAAMGSDRPEGYEIPENPEELRKTIQTAVLGGANSILLDNLSGPLKSSGLCAVLTLPVIKFRVLGGHSEVGIPNEFLFMVTGNNIQVLGDMGRRVQVINMDAGVADPWNRGFDTDLPDWVIENRPQFVWALLTLIRSWVVAGKPGPLEGCGFGKGDTYSKWAQVVGGIVGYHGWGVFAANRSTALDADPEQGEWSAFIEQVYEEVEGQWFYASVLADNLISLHNKHYNQRSTSGIYHREKYDPTLLLLMPSSLGKATDGSLPRRLGTQLAERVGVTFPDCAFKIEAKDGTKRRKMYRITKM